MRSIRHILLASVLTVSAFSAVTLTSCKKDDEGCAVGYEGTDCKTKSSAKFVGTYSVTEQCTTTGSVGPYTAQISESSSTSEVKILMVNFGDFNNPITITASVDKTSLSIAQQTVSPYTVSGTGTYNNGVISVNYTIKDSQNNTETCNATWTKQ